MVPRVIHGEAIVSPAFVILASTRGCVLDESKEPFGKSIVVVRHDVLKGVGPPQNVVDSPLEQDSRGYMLIIRRGVLDRFVAEIRNAAKLDHPNVVTAYSALRVGESLVLAMQYVEGLDLAKMVQTRGSLSVAQACNYVHQAALGLQHAHEHGMVDSVSPRRVDRGYRPGPGSRSIPRAAA